MPKKLSRREKEFLDAFRNMAIHFRLKYMVQQMGWKLKRPTKQETREFHARLAKFLLLASGTKRATIAKLKRLAKDEAAWKALVPG
jgi:hypothetical protein